MKTFESFESNRWIWRVNIALQVLLVLALAGIVNYIGMNAYQRIDLTGQRAFSLAPETLGYIRNLRENVTVVVTLTEETDDEGLAAAYRDVRGILREFEYAARNNLRGRIEVVFLNIYEERLRAETLGVDNPNVVVFKTEQRRRIVTTEELYRSRNRERSAFEGEKAFTSALLDVTSRERPVLYFLGGHGEMRRDNVDPLRGASLLDTELTARGFDTRTLDLTATRRVPDDASMVLVLSPQTPLLRSERENLREFLSTGTGTGLERKPGRVLLALDPSRNHGIEELLLDWGIQVDDVLVLEADPRYQVTGGDILIKRFAEHPITQVFLDNQISILLGLARSVRADRGRPIDSALEVSELLQTSDLSWGEASYRVEGSHRFDPSRDVPGPVQVAAVAKRDVDSRLGINLQGGRLLVFGSSDFLANNRLGIAGNKTLALNAINWAMDRDSQLDIPARPVQRLRLTLSQEQLAITRVSILVGPALLVALIGVAVLFARRR